MSFFLRPIFSRGRKFYDENILYFGEWLHRCSGRSGPIIVLALLSAAAAAALWSRMEIMVTLLISSV